MYRCIDTDKGRRPDLEIRGLLERGIYGVSYRLPSLLTTAMYVAEFNDLIHSLLADIMQLDADANDASAVLSAFTQSILRINDGGLGLGVLDATPHAAYLASVVACLPAINKYERPSFPHCSLLHLMTPR